MLKLSNKVSPKRIFIWNAVGSLFNALSTAVILIIVNRVLGEKDGGIVTISLALAQQLLTIANFETGTYYVTDGQNKFGFDVHFATKILLFAVSVAAAVCIAVYKYDAYKASVVIAFCIYKITDGFTTLSAGVLQCEGRLDLVGISLTVKTFIVMGLLTAFSLLTKGLVLTSWIVALFAILWTVFVDMLLTSNFVRIKPLFNFKKIGLLLIECVPLFFSTFLLTYIANQPKYVIDSVLSEEAQNTFGIIFMPSAVICMLGLFAYRPLLTDLTERWTAGDLKGFSKLISTVCIILAVITAVCVLGATVLGIPVLQLLFGVRIGGLRRDLCIILLGGGFYALSNLLYNVIVIFRKQRLMLVAYLAAYVISLIITKPMVLRYALTGASMSYFITNLFLALLLLIFCLVLFTKRRRELKNE